MQAYMTFVAGSPIAALNPKELPMPHASPEFSFALLYVDNPPASAAFYAGLLSKPILQQSPTFCMLPLREGVMLGLWSQHTVTPAPAGQPGVSELALTVADAAAVKATHADWAKRGLQIAQGPSELDFGTTFVALDPDGHRIRVFAPTGG
jgi:predicted enzyme related to lactoylglutathione lyase